MPLFRLSLLSRDFLEMVADESLLDLIPSDTSVYKVTVLGGVNRAYTLLFFAQVRANKILMPDWWTSEFEETLSDDLQIETRGSVCVYDSTDDNFHPTDVTHRISTRLDERIGILGWKDIESQFLLHGITANGNLVLFGVDGSKCRGRVQFQHELPQSNEN